MSLNTAFSLLGPPAALSITDAAKAKFVVVTDRHLYIVHGKYSHCFGLCDCCCKVGGYEDSVPISELTNVRVAEIPSVSSCYETCCPTAMSVSVWVELFTLSPLYLGQNPACARGFHFARW